MELSQSAIHDVIHPTAAFPSMTSTRKTKDDTPSSWPDSRLNPKNRIDSLDPLPQPKWRMDGCTSYGSQFYAVPLVPASFSPLRVDLYLPELTTLPWALRDALDTDVVFHTREANRIQALGITRHLLRILQHWTPLLRDLQTAFYTLPFGSRLVLENMPVDVKDAKLSVVPAHYMESHLQPLSILRKYWNAGLEYPPTVDLFSLKFETQLHDSVCLVRREGHPWIFKALANHTKFLYHELHVLLRIPSHSNVISKPRFLVTKRCGFGGKVAVVGFLLEYQEFGSLRNILPFLRIHGGLTSPIGLKWSIELASALNHLREKTGTFYPDLRLDNIVLSSEGQVVMVDFEQRGVWLDFASPEVNAFDIVRLLARDDDVPISTQKKYREILRQHLPDWESYEEGEEYTWPSTGYNVAWTCLTAVEQEASEVYMLGRVMWCIFEGNTAPQRAAPWLSYRWEPLADFPNYTYTPAPMRDLIDRCTRGFSPGLSRYIVREGNYLVRRGETDSQDAQVRQTAQWWWAKEVAAAENWIEIRARGIKSGTWSGNYWHRPSLAQVHEELLHFQEKSGLTVGADLPAQLSKILSGTRLY